MSDPQPRTERQDLLVLARQFATFELVDDEGLFCMICGVDAESHWEENSKLDPGRVCPHALAERLADRIAELEASPMSDDLAERLRNFPTPITMGEIRLLQDAADEIDRLRTALEESCRDDRSELWACPAKLETDRLRAALRSIANTPTHDPWGRDSHQLLLGVRSTARAALGIPCPTCGGSGEDPEYPPPLDARPCPERCIR